MAARNKALLGMTVAVLLVAGAAWASGEPVETNAVERTVIPVDPAGRVTLEVVPAGLSIVTVVPEPGWTVSVENSVGREVEAHLESDKQRVDFKAELEDGEIRIEIERRLAETSSTTTLVTTSSTATTSSTSPSTTSPTSTVGDDTTSTTAASVSSTSTTVDRETTSTTMGERASTTSTTVDGPDDDGTTSTTIDDDVVVAIPDGKRTFEAGTAGTITVDIKGGALTLMSVDARSGWSYEIEKARSDDIEVEFSQGDAEVEIRIRPKDGRLEVRVDAD